MLSLTRHAQRRIRSRGIKLNRDMGYLLKRTRELQAAGRINAEIPVNDSVYIIDLRAENPLVITAYVLEDRLKPEGHSKRIFLRRDKAKSRFSVREAW